MWINGTYFSPVSLQTISVDDFGFHGSPHGKKPDPRISETSSSVIVESEGRWRGLTQPVVLSLVSDERKS